MFGHLDPTGDKGVARLNVEGVEQREIALDGPHDGEYRTFVLATGLAGGGGHRYGHDADVMWAVGCLVYNWFMWNGIPVDAAHLTRALVEVRDSDRNEPLRSWFRVGYAMGRVETKPLKSYTMPGIPPLVHHYLKPRDADDLADATTLRLAAVLLPENRCPEPR